MIAGGGGIMARRKGDAKLGTGIVLLVLGSLGLFVGTIGAAQILLLLGGAILTTVGLVVNSRSES